MVLANLIGGFIVILVGVTLMPTIGDSVFEAKFQPNGSGVDFATNVTGASATLIDLTVIFFAIGVMAAGVALATAGLKEAGMV